MLTQLASGHTPAEAATFKEAYAAWNTANNKATGVITLRIAASLRHYCAANQSAHTFWGNLKTAFGAPSMPAIYADFKLVINTKLSGGNSVPEMERMATSFNCLAANNFTIANSHQGLILLAALPGKWDSDCCAALYAAHKPYDTAHVSKCSSCYHSGVRVLRSIS